jgi:hypothetical protein
MLQGRSRPQGYWKGGAVSSFSADYCHSDELLSSFVKDALAIANLLSDERQATERRHHGAKELKKERDQL